jgi:hypothetical protein
MRKMLFLFMRVAAGNFQERVEKKLRAHEWKSPRSHSVQITPKDASTQESSKLQSI